MRASILRLLNIQSLNRFKSEAPVYWTSLKTVNKEAFQKQFSNLNNWYTRLLGLDEVKLYQDRVVALQERLLETQEKRREIGRSLVEIRKKSNQLQDEIHKVKRQEDLQRFLELMKEETEVLRQENEVSRSFQECDQTEREVFTAFTNAVRDSHEKQRAQLEYTKYFGIILSIAGSFLAFCYTTLRKGDLKVFIEESLAKNAGSEVGLTRDELRGLIEESLAKNGGNAGPSDLVDFVRTETGRLTNMVNFKQKEIAVMLDKENEAKKRQFFYYLGASALLLVVFKVISTN